MQLLEEGMKNPAWPIRFACAEAWSDLNKNYGEEELLHGLKEKDPCIRDRSVQALGKRKDKKFLSCFQDALKEQDVLIRSHALEAICMTLEEQSLAQIQSSLQDTNPVIQECAVHCLENFIPKKHSHPVLKKILKNEDVYYYSIPVFAAYILAKDQDKEAKQFLYKMLDNPDSWIVFTAAKKLAQLKDDAGIDHLKQMLQWGKWKEKISALEGLIALGEKDDAVKELTCSGEAPDKASRLEIIRLLDAFLPENTGALLEEIFSSQEEEIRIRVLEILGEIKRSDLFYLAEDVVQKGPEYLRATLIKSIEKINNRNLLPYLLPILAKAHWLVRIQAARVILKLAL